MPTKKTPTAKHSNISGTANLKPWQPGQSGNPAGRPKHRVISEDIAEVLDEEVSSGLTKGHKIAQKLVAMAMAGNMAAIKEILDRTEGRPKQAIEHNGIDGSAILLSLQAQIDKVYRDSDLGD